jgi:hypothetical protein
MFANALRMQARLALLTARSVAVRPTTTALRMPMQMRLGAVAVGASRTLTTTRVQRYEVPSAPPRNPPAKTVWIGNLPFFVTEEEVREKFSPYGPISSIRLSAFFSSSFFLFTLLFSSSLTLPTFLQLHTHPPPLHCRHRPRRPLKRLRHIEFESVDDAVAAVESGLEEPFHLAGRDLRVDYGAERAGIPVNKLYFSGFVGEEQGLRALFGEFAPEIRSIFFCALPFASPFSFLLY